MAQLVSPPGPPRSWWLARVSLLAHTFLVSRPFAHFLTPFLTMLLQGPLTVFSTVLADMPFGGVLDNILKDFLGNTPKDSL